MGDADVDLDRALGEGVLLGSGCCCCAAAAVLMDGAGFPARQNGHRYCSLVDRVHMGHTTTLSQHEQVNCQALASQRVDRSKRMLQMPHSASGTLLRSNESMSMSICMTCTSIMV